MKTTHETKELTPFFNCSCGGKYQCIEIDGVPSVTHTLPSCVASEALEVLEYLTMQRKKREQ